MIRQGEHLGRTFGADETVDALLVSVAVGRDNEGGLLADAREVELGENAGRKLRQRELHDGREGRGLEHVGGACSEMSARERKDSKLSAIEPDTLYTCWQIIYVGFVGLGAAADTALRRAEGGDARHAALRAVDRRL